MADSLARRLPEGFETPHRVQAAPSYAIDIQNLSKQFRRSKRSGYTTLKSMLLSMLRQADPAKAEARNGYTEVLKDLTLRIPKGSSVGLIGRNGAGKSTFLKLVTGIYKPDHGKISVHGRVAALIELGAGFHPDFTGRENLFLGGVMHGLTREQIRERFDEIVHFAELEQVIDDPVRTYSSGMFMRLGFSLAVHTDPDVLLVDEVLAVGDASFVTKCKEKIAALRREKKTLVLVTHDLDAVERWCDEVLWLEGGVVRERGEPRRVIDCYRQFVERGEELELLAVSEKEREEDSEVASDHRSDGAAEARSVEDGEAQIDFMAHRRWGSREIEISAVRLVASGGTPRLMFHPDDSLAIEIDYRLHQELSQHERDDLVFGIGITRSDGVLIHGGNTQLEHVTVPALRSSGSVRYSVRKLLLVEGNYRVDVAVHRKDGYPYDYHQSAAKFSVRWPVKYSGVFVPEHHWSFE